MSHKEIHLVTDLRTHILKTTMRPRVAQKKNIVVFPVFFAALSVMISVHYFYHLFLGIKLKNSAYMLDDYKCDLGSIAHYCFILLDDLLMKSSDFVSMFRTFRAYIASNMLPKELGVYCLIAYALCNLVIILFVWLAWMNFVSR
ncbi:hypothetical protein ACJX0J_012150 [Zea mays]